MTFGIIPSSSGEGGAVTAATITRPKAYSYIRWSSAKQTLGDSLKRQTEKARQYALKNGLDLDDTSFLDAGVSAYKGDNTATGRLAEFIEAVQLGVVPRGSYLLVEHLDRISRQRVNRAMAKLEELCELGVNVVTLSDERTYTKDHIGDPMTFMYAAMLCIQAWEESRKKSERIRSARARNREQAAQGIVTTAKVPAWLRVAEGRAAIEVHEDRAEIVRRVYKMYDEGAGQTSIARALNDEGIKAFGGGAWNKTYIGKLVNSKAPAGILEQFVPREAGAEGPRVTKVAEVPDYYPIIVDPRLAGRVWLRAQSVQPKGRHAHKETRNLLAGVGRCPHCEGSMVRIVNSTRQRRRGADRLICIKGRTGGCSGKSVSMAFIVDAIRANLDQLLDISDRAGGPEVDVETANAEVIAARVALDRLAAQIAEDPSLTATLRTAIQIAQDRLAVAEKARREAIDAAEIASGAAWGIETDRFRAALGVDDVAAANQALRRMADSVVVDIEEKDLTFHWRAWGSSQIHWGKGFVGGAWAE